MNSVSVIMPVYQVEPYIAAALRSALTQTHPPLEVLVVDDGSTDRSIAICRQADDPRVRILHQENRGLAAARNNGIRHARGEYLAFLDGDDRWLPDKLRRHMLHFGSRPDVGISFSQASLIDEGGRPLGMFQMPRIRHDVSAADLLCRCPIRNGSAAVVRRQVFVDIRRGDQYFDESFAVLEDLECWLRVVLSTPWRIAGIPEVLMHYRTRTAGLSARVEDGLLAFERVLDRARAQAPAVIACWEGPARARYLRYRAQKEILLEGRDRAALSLMGRALRTDPAMALAEPAVTTLTLLGALFQALLPPGVSGPARGAAFQVTGWLQQRGVLRN